MPCCQRCGQPQAQTSALCHSCLIHQPWQFERNRCLASYYGEWKQLLHQYKGANQRQIALLFAQGLDRLYWSHYPGWLLVPVPPRAGKIKQKGWDQVDLLAKILQQRYRVPVLHALKRRDRTRQKTLTRAQRVSHQQQFCLKKSQRSALVGKRCLLLDDLLTTGTTLNRCALLLRENGAAQVQSLTVVVVQQGKN